MGRLKSKIANGVGNVKQDFPPISGAGNTNRVAGNRAGILIDGVIGRRITTRGATPLSFCAIKASEGGPDWCHLARPSVLHREELIMHMPVELEEDFRTRAHAIIRSWLRGAVAGLVSLTGDDADELLLMSCQRACARLTEHHTKEVNNHRRRRRRFHPISVMTPGRCRPYCRHHIDVSRDWGQQAHVASR